METAEKQDLQKRSFRIGGMTCVNCQNRIEKKLKDTAGIHDAAVNYATGEALVTYDAAEISFDEISAVIEKLGYRTLDGKSENTVTQIIGTLVIIFALFMLMRAFGTSRLAADFPLAETGMGYGMLMVIGLLTSVHCLAMCGGLNLSQTFGRNGERGVGNGGTISCAPSRGVDETEQHVPAQENCSSFVECRPPLGGRERRGLGSGAFSLLLPSLLYNGGRLVSYTLVGVLVGALGSVITLSGRFQGVVQLAAGVFMVIMGLNMLGLFPALRRLNLHMPKVFAARVDEQKTGRGPALVGFLNGFMPCGPLQAMQLYALSTGSPIRGGISMFLFCAGTIPLMFALGAASSALSGVKGQVFSRRVMQAGAFLVVSLGLVMFTNGWNLSGFTNPFDATVSYSQSSVQIVNSTLLPNRYPAITVQQDIPVRWIINAPPGSINGCNNRMIIREYGIQYTFKQGDNVIEFTPTRAGRFSYSCWMAMIYGTITVM